MIQNTGIPYVTYRNAARRGPSQSPGWGNTYKMVKFGLVVFELCERTDSRKTERQTDIPDRPGVKINKKPSKARFGRPYGKNGRLGGHIGETESRNTAVT